MTYPPQPYGLQAAMQYAPSLYANPGIALGVGTSSDPVGAAQAAALGLSSSSLQDAFDHFASYSAAAANSPTLVQSGVLPGAPTSLDQATQPVAPHHDNWLQSLTHLVGRAAHDVNAPLRKIPGVSGAEHAVGQVGQLGAMGMRDIQHLYRYGRAVIDQHGVIAGLAELGLAGAAAAATTAVTENPYAGYLAAVGTANALANVSYKHIWDQTKVSYVDRAGHPVSFGRDIANVGVHFDLIHKGSGTFDLVSGLGDAAFDIAGDPFRVFGMYRNVRNLGAEARMGVLASRTTTAIREANLSNRIVGDQMSRVLVGTPRTFTPAQRATLTAQGIVSEASRMRAEHQPLTEDFQNRLDAAQAHLNNVSQLPRAGSDADPGRIGSVAEVQDNPDDLMMHVIDGNRGVGRWADYVAGERSPSKIARVAPMFKGLEDQLARANTRADVAQVLRENANRALFLLPSEGLPKLSLTRMHARNINEGLLNSSRLNDVIRNPDGSAVLDEAGQPIVGYNTLGKIYSSFSRYRPFERDPERGTLNASSYAPQDSNHGAQMLNDLLRQSQSPRLADQITDDYRQGVFAEQRTVAKNAIIAGLIAKGVDPASPQMENLVNRGVNGMTLPTREYLLARDGSDLGKNADGVKSAMIPSQVGRWTIPDYLAVRGVVRGQGGAYSAGALHRNTVGVLQRLGGSADTWLADHYTNSVFKPLALINTSFAVRIALAEVIPGAFKFGFRNIAGAGFAKSAAKSLGPDEYAKLLAKHSKIADTDTARTLYLMQGGRQTDEAYQALSKVIDAHNDTVEGEYAKHGVTEAAHRDFTEGEVNDLAQQMRPGGLTPLERANAAAEATGMLVNASVNGIKVGAKAGAAQLKHWKGRTAFSMSRLLVDNDYRTVALATALQRPQHFAPPGLEAGTEPVYRGESPKDATQQAIAFGMGALPKGKRATRNFTTIAVDNSYHAPSWRAALIEQSRDPGLRIAADTLHKHYVAGPQTILVRNTALPEAAEAAGPGLPALYHGSPGKGIQGKLVASEDGLYGPGFYTTDNEAVARQYEGRDGATGHTYSVHTTGPHNLLDIDRTAGPVLREQMRDAANGLDLTPEARDNILMRANDAHATGRDLIFALRHGLTVSELPPSFVTKVVSDSGYEGLQYKDQLYGHETADHTVHVFYKPSTLTVQERPGRQAFSRQETPQELENRATLDAHTDLLRFMQSNAGRSHYAPIRQGEAWNQHQHAADLIEGIKGVTWGQHGDANVDLLHAIANRSVPSVKNLAYRDIGQKPLQVKGRELVDATQAPSFQGAMNGAFKRLIDPIINSFSREPLFIAAKTREFKYLKPMVASGLMRADDAMRLADTRAFSAVLPLIHNTLLRNSFSDTFRNVLPFYFAQEQAYRRYGKVILENPDAGAKLLLEHHALRNVTIMRTDDQGHHSVIIPGGNGLSGLLGRAAQAIGLPLVNGLPTNFSNRTDTLGTIIPEIKAPSMSPVTALALDSVAHFIPEIKPAVDALRQLGGGPKGSTNPIGLLQPNKMLNDIGKAAFGEVWPGNFSSQYAYQIMSAQRKAEELRYQASLEKDQKKAAGLYREADWYMPSESADPGLRNAALNRIKNKTRTGFLTSAFLDGFYPIGQTKMESGDYALRQDFLKGIQANGGDYQKAHDAFMEKHPFAAADTIAVTKAQNGLELPLSTHPAAQFLTDNAAFVQKFPWAAAYLLPIGKDGTYDQAAQTAEEKYGLRMRRSPQEILNATYYAQAAPEFYAKQKLYYDSLQKAQGNQAETQQIHSIWNVFQTQYFAAHPVLANISKDPDKATGAVQAMGQLLNAAASGALPAGPQTSIIVGLLNDYNKFATQYIQLKAARKSVSALDTQWSAYLDSVLLSTPNAATFVRGVLFRLPKPVMDPTSGEVSV